MWCATFTRVFNCTCPWMHSLENTMQNRSIYCQPFSQPTCPSVSFYSPPPAQRGRRNPLYRPGMRRSSFTSQKYSFQITQSGHGQRATWAMRLGCLPDLYIHTNKQLEVTSFPNTPPAFAAPLFPHPEKLLKLQLSSFTNLAQYWTTKCTILWLFPNPTAYSLHCF